MLAINVHGLLYTTRAALPHLLSGAADAPRGVADVVNISSIAGRVAWPNVGVYNLTKFGVNGFTVSLRQEVTRQHVQVGVLEPGSVGTELGSHNNDLVKTGFLEPFNAEHERLEPEDIADAIAFMVTRPCVLHRRTLGHAHGRCLTAGSHRSSVSTILVESATRGEFS